MNERASKIPTDEHRRRIQAWLRAATDKEAADQLGMEYPTFNQWRRNLGLPTCADMHARYGVDAHTVTRLLERMRHLCMDVEALEREHSLAVARQAKASGRPEPSTPADPLEDYLFGDSPPGGAS